MSEKHRRHLSEEHQKLLAEKHHREEHQVKNHQRLLRLAAVRERVPFSRSSLYKLIGEGRFPRPISVGGRARFWVESEVDGWVEARIASAREEVS